MKIPISAACLVLLLVITTLPCLGQAPLLVNEKQYDNPTRFEDEIRAFEALDKGRFPPAGAIVCIGSSSMKGWHPTIVADLAPLTIIPRGFGGSNMNDALYYAARIIFPYQPRAIVIYEGDNDIADGISPRKILATFHALVERIQGQLPKTRLYVLSIKPSISRWKLWPRMDETNRLLKTECARDQRLTYVDVASPMLDVHREPRKDIFQEDNLHMTRAGYAIWQTVLKPILIERELAFEPRKK